MQKSKSQAKYHSSEYKGIVAMITVKLEDLEVERTSEIVSFNPSQIYGVYLSNILEIQVSGPLL